MRLACWRQDTLADSVQRPQENMLQADLCNSDGQVVTLIARVLDGGVFRPPGRLAGVLERRRSHAISTAGSRAARGQGTTQLY